MMELLNEKYRPRELEDLVVNIDKEKFQEYIDNKSFPHFLFYGTPGTGKTTLAHILIDKTGARHLKLNASDERGIETIRNKVKNFCRVSSSNLKVILFEEADMLTFESQTALRDIMETYSNHTRFILLANYPNKIIQAIRESRCIPINIRPFSEEKIVERLKTIAEAENINHSIEDIENIVKDSYPDVRKAINMLEMSSLNGSLKYNGDMFLDSTFKDIWTVFRKGDIRSMREILSSNMIDYNALYKFYFDKFFNVPTEKLNDQKKRDGLLAISDYMYRSSIVADPEINFVAMCYKLDGILKESK